MSKLKAVVNPGDPTQIYSKIKKVGQGYVSLYCFWMWIKFNANSASGSVYVARHNASRSIVAIKQMDLMHQPRKELIVNEILVMKESHHPNIVNYLDSYLVKTDLWVIMEYMEGGPLTDVIDNNTMSEPQIATILNEVWFLVGSI